MGLGRSGGRRTGSAACRRGGSAPLLVALLVGLAVGFLTAAAATAEARARRTFADTQRFGPDLGRVQAAMWASQWPQARNNWCGVATVVAIARYNGAAATQEGVAATLDSAGATSLWGTPPSTPSAPDPGFRANISRDWGTDPRSLAAGLSIAGGAPYRQVVALGDAREATAHLVADLETTGEPISVIVDHGQHSAVISGVYADHDPAQQMGDVAAIEVWDPGVDSGFGQIQPAAMAVVPLEVWLTDPRYWGAPYQTNYNSSLGFEIDPDPDVGPYAVQGQAHLWIGHYVYLKRMAPRAPAALATPDWAFDETGALIAGMGGEMPPGYDGPAIPMPGTQPAAASPALTAHAPPAAGPTPPPGSASHPEAHPPMWHVRDFAQPWCHAGWCQPFAALPLLAVGPAAGGGAALTTTIAAMGVHGIGAARRKRRARRDAAAALPILPVYGRGAVARVEFVETEEIVQAGQVPREIAEPVRAGPAVVLDAPRLNATSETTGTPYAGPLAPATD